MVFSRVTDVDKLDLLLSDRGDGRIENIETLIVYRIDSSFSYIRITSIRSPY